MIKAIIFDFYGVICNEVGSNWYKTRAPQESLSELKSKYDQPSDLGAISEEMFFEGIGASVNASGEEVRQEWLDAAVLNKEIISLIQELESIYKLAICSNGPSKIFREILNEKEIKNAFYTIVCSSEIGMVKPNHDIYLLTLDKLRVRPEEAIFIDDREVNIQAAKELGIQGILYTNTPKLRTSLSLLLN
tara:strand:- start:16075 stop:16644 length:570 start_codon:yes stop_codon:yes gene_type:complete